MKLVLAFATLHFLSPTAGLNPAMRRIAPGQRALPPARLPPLGPQIKMGPKSTVPMAKSIVARREAEAQATRNLPTSPALGFPTIGSGVAGISGAGRVSGGLAGLMDPSPVLTRTSNAPSAAQMATRGLANAGVSTAPAYTKSQTSANRILESQNLKGKNYVVEYKKEEKAGTCIETIDVKGEPSSVTKNIQDIFSPQCQGKRLFHYTQDDLLVGGTAQNFLLYGNVDNPNQLIEIQNKKYKIKAYTPNGKDISGEKIKLVDEELDDVRFNKMKSLLESVEYGLENNKQNEKEFKDKQRQLNDLVKMFTTGLSKTYPGPNYIVESTTIEKNGECKETIQITGQPGSSTEHIKDTLITECVENRVIRNTQDEVLVGGADDKILVYGNVNNPDQLIEMQNGNYGIKTYPPNNDGTSSDNPIDYEDLDKDRSDKLGILLKNIEEGLENGKEDDKDFKDTQNRLGDLVKRFTTGDSKNYPGPNYVVESTTIEKNGECKETIQITGQPGSSTEHIKDTLITECVENRVIRNTQDKVLVGGADDKILVYGNVNNPDQLIEMQNGNYGIKTYPPNNDGTSSDNPIDYEDLDKDRSEKLGILLKNVEEGMENGKEDDKDFKDTQNRLGDLVKRFTTGDSKNYPGPNYVVESTTIEKNGECKETIQITGQPGSPTEHIKDTLITECVENRVIRNTQDKVLVGGADDKILVYGNVNNPDQLIEMQNGNYGIKTYPPNNDGTSSDNPIDYENLDKDRSDKLGILLKNVEEGLENGKEDDKDFKDTQNRLGDLVKRFTTGDSKNYPGPNFIVESTTIEKNGECKETIQITGQPGSSTEHIKDTLITECVENRVIRNTQDKVLVGGADDKILVYGNVNNPDQLIEMQNGNYGIKTYPLNNDGTSSDNPIDYEDLDKDRSDKLGILLKNVEEGLVNGKEDDKDFKDTQNRLGDLIKRFTTGDSKNYPGPNYVVESTTIEKNGECKETIQITGQPGSSTEHIKDTLITECVENRVIRNTQDEVLVGGADDKILVYGNVNNPDQLIEMQNGNYGIKTYPPNNDGTSSDNPIDYEDLDKDRSEKLGILLKNVEEGMENGKEDDKDFKDTQNRLGDLVKRFTTGDSKNYPGPNYVVESTTIEKNGECKETIQITGQPGSPTEHIKDTLITECVENRVIRNTQDKVLVGGADDKILVYGNVNNPDQLIEMQNGNYGIKTYPPNNDGTSSDNPIDYENLDKDRSDKLGILLKNVEEGLENGKEDDKDFKDTQNRLGDLVKRFTTGDSKNYPGPNFIVESTTIEKNGECKETIQITGQPGSSTEHIKDTLITECVENRVIRNTQDKVLVGGADDKILVYGNVNNPDQLIEMQNGNYGIKTYPLNNDGTSSDNPIDYEDLDKDRSDKLGILLKNVEEGLVNGKEDDKDFKDTQNRLGDLIKRFTTGDSKNYPGPNYVVESTTIEKNGECKETIQITGQPGSSTEHIKDTLITECVENRVIRNTQDEVLVGGADDKILVYGNVNNPDQLIEMQNGNYGIKTYPPNNDGTSSDNPIDYEDLDKDRSDKLGILLKNIEEGLENGKEDDKDFKDTQNWLGDLVKMFTTGLSKTYPGPNYSVESTTIEKNGECKETIQITGQPGSSTEHIKDTLITECVENRVIRNTQDEVLVGGADDKILVYGNVNNPDQLIEMQNGNYGIKTYPPNNDGTSSDNPIDYEDLDKDRSDKLGILLKNIEKGLENGKEDDKDFKDTQNRLGDLVKRFTTGDSKNYPGPNYVVESTTIEKNGECKETIQITGQPGSSTEHIKDTLITECVENRVIRNTQDEVLVGGADDKILVYGNVNNPDQLIEMQNGNYGIKTYPPNNDGTSSDNPIDYEDLDKDRSDKLGILLKNVEEGLENGKEDDKDFKDTQNRLGDLVKRFTTGDSKNYPGPNYVVESTTIEKNGECKETIQITGQPGSLTEHIKDTLITECVENRVIRNTQDEVLVGGADDKILVYGNVNNPDQLIEMQNGNYGIKTYPPNNDGTSSDNPIDYEDLDKDRSDKLGILLKNIEEGLENGKEDDKDFKDTQNRLGDLVKRFTTGDSKNYPGPNYVVESTTIEKNGECKETIQITGQAGSPTEHIKDTLITECVENRVIRNTQDKVLVGGADDKILVYGNVDNPDQLIEMQNGNYGIKTYPPNNDGTSSDNPIDYENLDKDRSDKLGILLKNIEEGLENGKEDDKDFKDTQNRLGDLVKRFTTGDSKNYPGPNYVVESTTIEKNGECKETIQITGQPGSPTEHIKDTLITECVENRVIRNTQDKVLVGGADDKILLYGNVDNPDRLMEMQNGKFRIKTYPSYHDGKSSDTGQVKVKEITNESYDVLKELVKMVEDDIVDETRNVDDFKDKKRQLNELVKKLTKNEDLPFYKKIWVWLTNLCNSLKERVIFHSIPSKVN